MLWLQCSMRMPKLLIFQLSVPFAKAILFCEAMASVAHTKHKPLVWRRNVIYLCIYKRERARWAGGGSRDGECRLMRHTFGWKMNLGEEVTRWEERENGDVEWCGRTRKGKTAACLLDIVLEKILFVSLSQGKPGYPLALLSVLDCSNSPKVALKITESTLPPRFLCVSYWPSGSVHCWQRFYQGNKGYCNHLHI